MYFFIESIHGVTVDIANNIQLARKLRDEVSGFRQIPRFIVIITSAGKRMVIK